MAVLITSVPDIRFCVDRYDGSDLQSRTRNAFLPGASILRRGCICGPYTGSAVPPIPRCCARIQQKLAVVREQGGTPYTTTYGSIPKNNRVQVPYLNKCCVGGEHSFFVL